MVGCHHLLNGHGFGWTPGVGDGQGGLACRCPWGHEELDTSEQLNQASFAVQGLFSWMLSHLFISAFVAFTVLGVRFKNSSAGGFPSGLVGKTLLFHCKGHGFDP